LQAKIAVEALIYYTLAVSLLVPVIRVGGGPGGARSHAVLALTGLIAFATASALLASLAAPGEAVFYGGLVVHDPLSSVILLGASVSGVFTLMSSWRAGYEWSTRPSLFSLLPLTMFGLFFLAGARDLLVALASWLLVSMISYVIIALPDDEESRKASTRYIYVGTVATLFLGAWIAVNAVLSETAGAPVFGVSPPLPVGLSALSIILLLTAFGFKTGIAPFHWWLPSVYGRADGRVVAIVASVAKLGFIAFLARAVIDSARGAPPGGEALAGDVALILSVAAVATMTYGNIAAMTPTSLRAVLAYSSIAQIGYILAGLAVAFYLHPIDPSASRLAIAGVAVQTLAYAIAKAPLFSLASFLGDDIRGLRALYGHRMASLSASVLLLSLLGVPPLIGFWGKLFLFVPMAKF
jgi:NADH-quinone oxidoreductase subunit N